MIIRCPKCETKNRLPLTIPSAGIFSCKICTTALLTIEQKYNHSFLFSAITTLQEVEESLKNISKPYFAQEAIKELEEKSRHAKSRLELWKHHSELLVDEEKIAVCRSYSPVLMESSEIIIRIDELIAKKSVYKELAGFLRRLQSIVIPVVDIINMILPIFGIPQIVIKSSLLTNEKS